jgi:hypothetical protein
MLVVFITRNFGRKKDSNRELVKKKSYYNIFQPIIILSEFRFSIFFFSLKVRFKVINQKQKIIKRAWKTNPIHIFWNKINHHEGHK